MPSRTARTALALALLLPGPALAGGGHSRAYPGHHDPAPTGTLVVQNRAPVAITVRVADREVRTLGPYATQVFTVPAGEPRVRASFVQFGVERVLEDRRVYVPPYRSATVDVAPERTARILVSNVNPEPAELLVDGRFVDSLAPFQEEVIAVPAGYHELTLRAVGSGRALGRTRMDLRAMTEPRWRVEAPRYADVVVVNPLPIAIDLVCDRGLHRTLAPGARTVYEDVPFGTFHLTARRMTGERVDEEYIPVRTAIDATWRIDPPRTGLVQLDSEHWLPVTVRADGRAVASLAPDQDLRVELPLGWQHVEVRDAQGRTLLDTWVDVDPYDTERVRFGYDRHQRAYDGRVDADDPYDRGDDPRDDHQHDHEHDHDDHRGSSCTMR